MTTGTYSYSPVAPDPRADHDRYKWVALTNTTIGILMVTINARSC